MVREKYVDCSAPKLPLLARWLPETGGANLPALNNLLKPLGIAFGDTVLEGNFDLGEHMIYYASGTFQRL